MCRRIPGIGCWDGRDRTWSGPEHRTHFRAINDLHGHHGADDVSPDFGDSYERETENPSTSRSSQCLATPSASNCDHLLADTDLTDRSRVVMSKPTRAAPRRRSARAFVEHARAVPAVSGVAPSQREWQRLRERSGVDQRCRVSVTRTPGQRREPLVTRRQPTCEPPCVAEQTSGRSGVRTHGCERSAENTNPVQSY